MDSLLVNARVPRAKKEASTSVLKAIGATTSELINSAYDYLLEYKELPSAKRKDSRTYEDFAAFAAESTLSVDWGKHPESFDYKEFMRARKQAEYESLA